MLITAAEVADPMGGLSPTDTLLVSKVNEADSWAKQMLGRQFERRVYALKPRVYGVPYVLLRESPIRAIVSAYSDVTGKFSPGTSIDISRFTFNPDPQDDDPRLNLADIGYGWPSMLINQGVGTFLVNVEAGWWPADDQVNVSDMPSNIREMVATRARVKFKQAIGITAAKDDEVKIFTDEYILNALYQYNR